MTENNISGNKIIFTGQTGLDKKSYLENMIKICKEKYDKDIKLFHVGDMMYDEAKSSGGKIEEGKILNLSLLRLNCLRRSITKDIYYYCKENPKEDIIINTHACFRWRHGLFLAYDFDLLKDMKINKFITLIDDVDSIYSRILNNKNIEEKFSLKDIMVWREEEVSITKAISLSLDSDFYLLSRKNPIDTVAKLIFTPNRKKTYLSFPITKVVDKPEILKKIQDFKELMARNLIIWDPITIGERRLLRNIQGKKPQEKVTIETLGHEVELTVNQIDVIKQDIDGQIISRDYRLIDQSDFIITYIPEIDGEPDISAGCQTEVHYAYELPRQVFILWESKKEPSPWIVQNATKVFKGDTMFEDLSRYFREKGFF